MRIEYLLIRNFKSIRELEINDIEDVLILVGRNNAGKSVVLDAIRAVTGDYEVSLRDFNDNEGNISITVRISIEDEDLPELMTYVFRGQHRIFWEGLFLYKYCSS